MKKTPVIIIFDVGKTNKKIFAFDEDYRVVYQDSTPLPEIKDEDGFPCENLDGLIQLVVESLQEVGRNKEYNITAVNFSAYGASFVYLDKDGKVLLPLYNYLKPYPQNLQQQFLRIYFSKL